MRIITNNSRLELYGINKAIANMIPGASYQRKGRFYTAPLSAAPTLARAMPTKTPKEVREIARNVLEREQAVEEVKQNGCKNDHTFLMEHQNLCLNIARQMPSYAFFLETGTGKTALGLSIIAENLAKKWLVVCPKAIIKTAWLEDAQKFYPDIKIMPWKRGMRKREIQRYCDAWGIEQPQHAANVLVCNYESFRLMTEEFLELGVKGVIFDESVKIKNPQASVTKEAIKFCRNMENVYLLSGIPAPNSELEYFTQMQVVDPAVFGTNYWRFRHTYFSATDWFQRNWELNPMLKDKFMERLASRSIVIRKQDCLDLPPMTAVSRMVALSGKAKKYYKDMHKKRVLEIAEQLKENETTIIAPNRLAQLMKLRQITSGFIIDNEANTKPLHTAKLRELSDVLEELGGEQAIIWCNFRNEIHAIKDMLGDKAVTAYGGTKDIDASIDAFKSGQARYIIAHPQTLKYGVTLTNCTYAVYYSLSYSYDDFAQSKDRIHRFGQDEKTTLIFLLAEDTIDMQIFEVLLGKKTKDDAIKELLTI